MKSITDDLSESNIEKIFNGIDSSGDKKIDLIEFKVDNQIHITLLLIMKSDGHFLGDDEEDN